MQFLYMDFILVFFKEKKTYTLPTTHLRMIGGVHYLCCQKYCFSFIEIYFRNLKFKISHMVMMDTKGNFLILSFRRVLNIVSFL